MIKTVSIYRGKSVRMLTESSPQFSESLALRRVLTLISWIISQLYAEISEGVPSEEDVPGVSRTQTKKFQLAKKFAHRVAITLQISEGLRLSVEFFEINEKRSFHSWNVAFDIDTGEFIMGGGHTDLNSFYGRELEEKEVART